MEQKNIYHYITERHKKLHTLFVSKPIKISNIRIIVDDATDFNGIISQLEENKECINGIDIPNKEAGVTLSTMACFLDDKNTSSLLDSIIKLGANPNSLITDKPKFDPWRPFYPNPRTVWETSYEGKMVPINLVDMVT